jgi:hypothetical protein
MSHEYCIGCDGDKNPSGHPFGGYLAVDGYSRNNTHNPDSKYFGNCARTEKNSTSWIMVDFGGLYAVHTVSVYGNKDG